jgi:transglutaminase-like putative cysteine protease
MKFNLGCQLSYAISEPSTLIFNVAVPDGGQTVLEEDLVITPSTSVEEYSDPVLKNRFLRVNAAVGEIEISYRASVEKPNEQLDPSGVNEVSIADLPLEVVPYLYPSRYCQSDQLTRLVTTEFGYLVPGYSRVTAICNWIYDNVTYISGSSDSHTSAYDTVTQRAGVCRDFAHLAIAFCRALGIPARFVTCYAYKLDPPDFHACLEAYLEGGWYLFDPTRLVPLDGTVRIGIGRDAADVAFANLFGAVQMQQMNVFINRQELG